ncbi:MAG: response regulator transcription factor [Rhodocyclaceae bacterium]|nr:response regulator transcription factor [Rhodocyclaceae bacterium]
MQTSGLTVYIVEDDQSVRDAVGLLLGLNGHAVAMFADAESFLQAYRPEWSGCLLLDIRMPGMNGLELQERMARIGCRMPAIVMTGHGDVDSARQAFRAQAVDFLEKPLDQARLLDAIAEAFQCQDALRRTSESRATIDKRLAALTPRELEVMELVVAGRHNRDIAAELGISVRTVEVHKARMMDKLGAANVADLVRLSLGAGAP